jgi:mannonate dehydratase
MTFCQGCFIEMGENINEAIRRFASRIHFVHFRDVQGCPTNFRETFPDNGPTDMIEMLKTYRDIGYKGFIRVDHVPQLATEGGDTQGYGLVGHTFAIGYLKGLMEPIFGRPAAIADSGFETR